MLVEYLEQLHERDRGLGFAALITAERVGSSAKNFCGLLLRQLEPVANLGEQVNGGQFGVHLLVEQEHLLRRSYRLANLHYDLAALRVVAKLPFDGLDNSLFPFIAVGHVADRGDEPPGLTSWALHSSFSLNEIMRRSSTMVSL